jgi:hypothetical protein
MRKLTASLLLGLCALLCAPALSAQAFLNAPLPKVELDGYAQTKAAKFEDYQGRAVLIEFFAHW